MNTTELLARLRQDPATRILDVRTPGEFGNAHINGAYNVPLDLLEEHAHEIRAARAHTVVLVCQSGQRASRAEALLRAAGMDMVHVLDGGMNAWIAGHLPVKTFRRRISLERQVRITAGAIVAAGSVAALAVSPLLALVPAAIGVGLVFSGVTDTCGMAMVLARLPYNRAGLTCDTEAVVRQFLAHDTSAS